MAAVDKAYVKMHKSLEKTNADQDELITTFFYPQELALDILPFNNNTQNSYG